MSLVVFKLAFITVSVGILDTRDPIEAPVVALPGMRISIRVDNLAHAMRYTVCKHTRVDCAFQRTF
jgi:stage III sporulation protein SpoIIIAA